jgi:tetratricopeptide (TPR) repeat protein
MIRGKSKMRISLTPRALRVSAVLAVSLALGLTTGCHRDPNKVKLKYLESGKRYAAEGKLKEANIQFANALKVDRNYADAHYELSKVYIKQGAMMPAYAELLRTVDLQPNNIQARIDLGNLLLAGKAPDKATVQAKAVLAINSNNADAYALLANIAFSKGDRAEALTQIQHAISLDPNRATFHTTMGLLQSGDPATAASGEEQLRKAVSLDSKNTNAAIMLASILMRKGDFPGAQEQLKAAVAADPKNPMIRAALADVYLRQNNQAAAEQVLRQTADDLGDTSSGAELLATYYIRSRQLDKAETAYADLVAKHPKSAPLKLAYARILLLKKDVTKAKVIALELAKTDSSLPEVAILNSLLLLNDGKINDAFELLQKAAKTNPDNVQVKIWLGRTARAKGDLTVAQQSFRDAARLAPKNKEAQDELAQVSIQAHDFATLAQIADASILASPESADPYVWRGMTEGNEKNYDKAEADFKEAIRLDPKNWTAPMELAQLRLIQKKVPEAQVLLEQALTNNPNSAQALRMLAATYLIQKQPAKALSRVQEQIAKAPRNSEMLVILADLQTHNNDNAGALASAQKAMDINPADSSAVMAYSHAQIALGKTDEAIAKWQQWIGTHPTDDQALSILGSLEQAQGNFDKATEYYKKALAIRPEQPIAANNLAYLMVQNGQNLDVALSLAQVARRGMPNSPSTADTLAWIYYQKGNYSSARDLLEDAVKVSPDSASINYHLGMTYAKLSNKTDAVVHLKKAASLAPNTQTAKDADKELGLLG